jgi:hypothetical protein
MQLTSPNNFFEIDMLVGFHILIFSFRAVFWYIIHRITVLLLLTNSMELSATREATSFVPTRQFPPNFMEPDSPLPR